MALHFIINNSMYIFIGFLIVITLAVLIVYQTQKVNSKEVETRRDTRKNLTPNATNYNQSMYDRSQLEQMNKEELQQLLEHLQESDISSLSPRDFHFIKRRLKELE